MTSVSPPSPQGPSAALHYRLLALLFAANPFRRGYGRLTRWLARPFDPANLVEVGIEGGQRFKVYLDDEYWTRVALGRDRYEPEVGRVLQAAAGATRHFCDLGANMGYWTLRAAPTFACLTAVEASPSSFARLSENLRPLPRVNLHHAAVHSASGGSLRFICDRRRHAAARVSQGDDPLAPGEWVEQVPTLCIDDLIPAGEAALIKLDVEGAEVAAIQGARRALNDGAVLIYEDHGADPDCAPSARLLEMPGVQIHAIQGAARTMTSIAQIAALKTDRRKGYNFIAGRGDSALLAAILSGV